MTKQNEPSPYELRLREIAAKCTNATSGLADSSPKFKDAAILAVLRSELEIESLMETISSVVEAPNVPHPAALQKLREWRDKWKR